MTPKPAPDPQALADDLARARTELAALEAAAVEAGRIKAQFLANMSHELRTPMNGVLGMAELLNDTALTGEQREYIDVLTSSARMLLRVVDDILDYTEIETGKLALERAPFHLHRCIGDTLRLLAPAARAKGLDLAAYVDPRLPESVHGDLARLRQVVSTLTANAIKFTTTGAVRVELRAWEGAATGTGLLLHGVVRGAGAGGPGLSLAISQRLVEMMGGRLWVEGEAGESSAFHFTLAVDADPRQPSLADAYRERLTGARALVVHEQRATREAVGLTLESSGMGATLVETADAVRRLRARDPRIDVVVLGMPAGVEVSLLLADIQAASPALPVLLLASPQEAARCSDLPIHSFLAEPVPATSLLTAVASALAPAALGDPPRRPARRDRFRGLRVLVAEDNPINQQVITLMLEGWGVAVTIAASGSHALAALDRQRFDLVLMDVQMPDGDGFETTKEVRAREGGRAARLPIVALTAQREDRSRCLAAGMDDYLAKPIVPAELADLLERVAAVDGSHA